MFCSAYLKFDVKMGLIRVVGGGRLNRIIKVGLLLKIRGRVMAWFCHLCLGVRQLSGTRAVSQFIRAVIRVLG